MTEKEFRDELIIILGDPASIEGGNEAEKWIWRGYHTDGRTPIEFTVAMAWEDKGVVGVGHKFTFNYGTTTKSSHAEKRKVLIRARLYQHIKETAKMRLFDDTILSVLTDEYMTMDVITTRTLEKLADKISESDWDTFAEFFTLRVGFLYGLQKIETVGVIDNSKEGYFYISRRKQ